MDRTPDRYARCHEAHQRCCWRAKAQSRPDREWEDSIFQWVIGYSLGQPPGEHDLGDNDQGREQRGGLGGTPRGLHTDAGLGQAGQQHRGCHQIAHRVPLPPHPPDRTITIPGLDPSQAQAGDPNSGAHDRTEARGKPDQSENILDARKRRAKFDKAAKQVSPQDSLQCVSQGDATGRCEGLMGGEISQECP